MKLKIAYWLLTGLFCLMMTFSGVMYLSGAPQVLEEIKKFVQTRKSAAASYSK